MPGAPMIDPVKAAQAVALGEMGYPSTQIAPIVGINDRSIRDILNKHGRWGELADTPVFTKLRLEQKKVLEASYRAGAGKLLARAFDEDKLEKASTYQLVIASSIALDKSQLLAGEPTEITATVNLHAIEGLDRLATLLSRTLLPTSNNVSREAIEIKAEQKQGVKT